ncbi:MAG: hypothetical protein U1F51_16900 [Burkholderiales bacterium]
MSAMGTLAWSSRRQGRLTLFEEASMTLALLGRRVMASLHGSGTATALLVAPPTLPDSRPVLRALEHAREECNGDLLNHCVRTYFWGLIFGARRGARFDREMLAIAALLHDLELGRTDRRDDETCACFAGAGARSALRFLTAEGLPEDRALRIADAISLHLNPIARGDSGVEARLLGAGAAMDVVGAGASAISPGDRATVLAAYPRGDFAVWMRAAMRRERTAAPRTRAALLMRLGFGTMISRADETVFARASDSQP